MTLGINTINFSGMLDNLFVPGRLQAGDHVLRVNDDSLEGVTNER